MLWAEPSRFTELEVASQIYAVCLDRILLVMGFLLFYLDLPYLVCTIFQHSIVISPNNLNDER